jgi:hypothetical protein
LVVASNHILTGPQDFTEVSSSQVQFSTTSFSTGDVVVFYNAYGLVDGSSVSLGKTNSIYDAVVGTSAQLNAGYASYTSLQAAINAVSAGAYILLLTGTTENITLSKNVIIEGKGYGTAVTGTFAISGNYATIRDITFGGNLSISGNGNIIRDCFLGTGLSVTDTGTANTKNIVGTP